MMSEKESREEKRRFERLLADLPVIYKIGRHTLTGTTVNVSNEGLFVESSLSAKTASNVFKTLCKNPKYRLEMEYSYQGRAYVRDAEVKHFHMDSSGSGPYRLKIGFWIPRME
jgi:hypothetical protein